MPELSPEVMNFINASWPIVLMAIVFYFLFYRPQQKEQKQRSKMLSSLKKGDRIITIGGLHGSITALNDKNVTLKVAEKVEIVISRSAVAQYQFPENGK